MSEFKIRLEQTRKKLLDLTRRNRLINYKHPNRGRFLTIIDESPEFIYQYLVFGEKRLTFKPLPEPLKSANYLKIETTLTHLEKHDYKLLLGKIKENHRLFIEKHNFKWSKENTLSPLCPSHYKKLDSFIKALQQYLKKRETDNKRLINLSKEIIELKTKLEKLKESKSLNVSHVAKQMGFSITKEMPEIDFIDSSVEQKHADLYLQTLHFPSELEKVLHKTHLNARTIIQESGSNMLYLILGVLEWKDRDNTKLLKSPLIAVPVHLQRGGFNKEYHTYNYTLEYNGDPITANDSLSEKLKNDFDITLPTLTENMSFNNYMHEVKKICSPQNGWKIRQEMALDFLQFGKILMYKDLNPIHWEAHTLEKNKLLNDLFLATNRSPASYAPQEYDIDEHQVAKNIPLVLDADSSQHSAIVDVMMGKNVVIEGPPGTGKSQIIANLIASLIADKKSVLFVSEKLVALEVVYQRLEKIGLGDFCLELHSHKSEKKKVLENLKKRVTSSYTHEKNLLRHHEKLNEEREYLSLYLKELHQICGNSGKSYFEIFWLLESYQESKKYLKIRINNAENLTEKTVESCVDSLEKYKRFHENYDLTTHFWKGVIPHQFNIGTIDTMMILLHQLHDAYALLSQEFKTLEIKRNDEINEVEKLIAFKTTFEEQKIAPYFSWNQIEEYRAIHRALHAYMESYQSFSLIADFENIETEEIINSLKPALGILQQLSKFETDFKEEIEGYQHFIIDAEKEHQKFEEIAKRTVTHFNEFAIYQKSVDSLLNIALVVNKRRGGLFRFLFSDYRHAIKGFEYILKEPLPDKHTEWVLFLRDLNLHALNRENQFKLRYNLKVRIELFLRNIKKVYKSIDTTLKLYDFINTSPIDNTLKDKFLNNLHRIEILNPLLNRKKSVNEAYKKLASHASIDKSFYLNDAINFNDRLKKLNVVEQHRGTLALWNEFQIQVNNLNQMGLQSMLEHVEHQHLPLNKIIENFYFNYYNSLLIKKFDLGSTFNTFSRTQHTHRIEKFRTLDKELLELNREEVAYRASTRPMPKSEGKGRVHTFTNLKLINHEIGKKTRHIPIRELINRAGTALQGLKPCFMMSPLSVSQYLPPNAIDFDVLLIDEASQLRPEEVLGVIARTHQVVIVGDPKQLPPTAFFQAAKEESSDDDTIVDEAESILDSAIELYNPVRRLKWHYRSQHESLIDFSNRHFYDNDLMIFPSPTSIKSDAFGLKHTYIPDGYYQGGANHRHNQREAEVVVEHIEAQIAKYPNKSLGVGTFNSAQKELIQQLIDEREKSNEALAIYLEKWQERNEPFFIKNLESLQGDERDVIYISTTYGKDIERKKVMQRFGPINHESGWRRLNVLITRAKQKMHIFTSLASTDIRVSDDSSRGIKSLRDFLKFLEQGAISHKGKERSTQHSNFSNAIAKILNAHGIKTVSNIGISGYFLDLAVLDKNGENSILAIECDGENYYQSKSASDRDRLKDEVLKRLGWKTYRIWSVDWYKNRKHEIENLLTVIHEANEIYANQNK